MTFPKEDIILVKILRGFKIGGKKGELQEGQVKSGASPHESDMTLRGHLRGSICACGGSTFDCTTN